MSNRSINGFTTNIRSLNGLEGVALESVLGGDAISITDTSKSKKTINVDISKQDAVTSVADDDLFVLENASGSIKKITGLHLKDSSDGFFFKNNNDIFCDLASDNLVIGSVDTSINSGGFKLHVSGTSKFTGAITSDTLSTFNAGLAVKNTSDGAVSGFVRIFDKDASHYIDLHAGGTAMSIASNKNIFLPDATGTVALLESLSATAPIVYNNSTGAFTFDNSTTNYITLSSLSASSPLSYNDSTGAFTTTFTATSTDNMSGKTFTDYTTFNAGLKVKGTATNSASIDLTEASNNGTNVLDLHAPLSIGANRDIYFPDSDGTVALLTSLSASSPLSYNNSTGAFTTTFTPTSTTNMSGKTFTTLTPFNEGLSTKSSGSAGLIRMYDAGGTNFVNFLAPDSIPSSNYDVKLPTGQGTLALDDATHTSKWNDIANKYIPTNSSLTSIDLPNNTSIRNALDTNQFIKFVSTGSASTEKIQLASAQVEVEGKIVSSANNAYYLNYGNGILDSTFNEIHIPENSYIMNDADTGNDYIQFKADILYVNYNQIDLKSGASSSRIRNATTTTNFIQLDTTYGLFVNLNCKVAGTILNCADNRLQIEEVGTNARVHMFDPQGTDNGASIAGAYISYHLNGTELHLNAPNDSFDNTLSSNINFRMAGDVKVRVNGLARESLEFFGNTNVSLSGSNYHRYGSFGMTEGGVNPTGCGQFSSEPSPDNEEFMGFFGGNMNNNEGFVVANNSDLMFIGNAGNTTALRWYDEDYYDGSQQGWSISPAGGISTFSDKRAKTKITSYKNINFDKFKKIRVATYKLKEPECCSESRKKDPKYVLKYNDIHYGVIAQEFYDLYPELESTVGLRKRKKWNIKKEKWDELYPEELRKWNKRKKDFDKSCGKEKKDFKGKKPSQIFNEEEPLREMDYNRINLLTVGVVQQLIETVEKQQEQINSLKTTIDKLNQSKSFKEFKQTF